VRHAYANDQIALFDFVPKALNKEAAHLARESAWESSAGSWPAKINAMAFTRSNLLFLTMGYNAHEALLVKQPASPMLSSYLI
jgi:hypothetical protein